MIVVEKLRSSFVHFCERKTILDLSFKFFCLFINLKFKAELTNFNNLISELLK